MNVVVNGEPRELPAGAGLEAAVRASGSSPGERGVAVALDGEVVPRARWKTVKLGDGQRVEVLRASQGG